MANRIVLAMASLLLVSAVVVSAVPFAPQARGQLVAGGGGADAGAYSGAAAAGATLGADPCENLAQVRWLVLGQYAYIIMHCMYCACASSERAAQRRRTSATRPNPAASPAQPPRQDACHTTAGCVWCRCAAVPSACYTAEQAKRLPAAVFTVRNQLGKRRRGGGQGGPVPLLVGIGTQTRLHLSLQLLKNLALTAIIRNQPTTCLQCEWPTTFQAAAASR
jgi:hypothetical protein